MQLINFNTAIAILLSIATLTSSAPVADPKTSHVKPGGTCNDSTRHCHHGLVCVDTSAAPGIYKPVAPNCDGICRRLVQEGQKCGDNSPKQDVCRKGLSCYVTSDPYAISGVCRKVAGKGRACGGDPYSSNLPIVCRQGLTCKSHKSDKPGFGHCE